MTEHVHDHNCGFRPLHLTVGSERMADGSFGLAVNVGDDIAWTMGRSDAFDYASMVVRIAMIAEHNAVLFDVLRNGLQLSDYDAAMFVVLEVYPKQPAAGFYGPIDFKPGVGAEDGAPFVSIYVKGEHRGQCTPGELKLHGLAILEGLAAAKLDQITADVFRNKVGRTEEETHALLDAMHRSWSAHRIERLGWKS